MILNVQSYIHEILLLVTLTTIYIIIFGYIYSSILFSFKSQPRWIFSDSIIINKHSNNSILITLQISLCDAINGQKFLLLRRQNTRNGFDFVDCVHLKNEFQHSSFKSITFIFPMNRIMLLYQFVTSNPSKKKFKDFFAIKSILLSLLSVCT